MSRATHYEAIGGRKSVERIVQVFYQRLDEHPNTILRALYPDSLELPALKLTLFLIAWWGGPTEYHATYGHPRLRKSHACFPIDASVRDAWMDCMRFALDQCVGEERRQELLHDFAVVAEHVRNR